jgi:hypothetical protein
MTQSNEVSVREASGITDIAEDARAREAYNRLYAQSLPIARSGDESTLDLYFGAFESSLNDAETKYNYAVTENKPDAVELGVKLSEAVVDYSASLDVKYDVVEDAEAETLLPEVNLNEDETDALAFPIDAARQVEGGNQDVTFRLMQLFRAILDVETQLAQSDSDLELATALARAREEYRWTKEYAVDTGADQVGLNEEERAAAERAASGEEEEAEAAPPNENMQAILEKQIADQRALEEAERAEAIRIAEEESAAAEAAAAEQEAQRAAAEAAAKKASDEAAQADALMALLEAQEA